MLQKEFEERTKLSISEAEYAKIDALYLACGDEIDKDAFCKLFMSFEGRLELMHMIEREKQTSDMRWDVACKRVQTIEQETAAKHNEIAEFMLRKATEHKDSECYNGAVALVGMRNVVMLKLKLKLPLCENDMDYINNHLK